MVSSLVREGLMRSLSRSVSLVVGVSLAWATSASAVRVPGSPAKAGCYAVFDVEGGSASGKKVTCSDCDASCDIGGPGVQGRGNPEGEVASAAARLAYLPRPFDRHRLQRGHSDHGEAQEEGEEAGQARRHAAGPGREGHEAQDGAGAARARLHPAPHRPMSDDDHDDEHHDDEYDDDDGILVRAVDAGRLHGWKHRD